MTIEQWSQHPARGTSKYALGTLTREEMQAILSRYREVDEETWRHGYSQVAGCDISGELSLKDGRQGRWMLRPGGLCLLEWSDGRVTFLAG